MLNKILRVIGVLSSESVLIGALLNTSIREPNVYTYMIQYGLISICIIMGIVFIKDWK